MRSADSGRSRKRTGIAAWVTRCSARRGSPSCCTRRICVARSAPRSAPSPRASRRRSPRKRTICCNTMPRCASTFFRSDSRSWRRTASTCIAGVFWWCNRRQIVIPCRSHRAAGLISDPISSEPGCNARRRWCGRRTSERQSPKGPAATLIGTRSTPMIQSSRRASRRGCSWSRTRGRESSANMAIDTGAVDRALGAIGTTFRLTRLYPPSHPAVLEAMRQITAALPGLAALGTVEWKIGATGLHWHGQHLLPRNTQVAELAGLLFARGIRAIQVNPGVTPEHWLGLFGVAVGNVSPDDAVLGRITVLLGRRATQRLSASRALSDVPPAPAAAVPPPPVAVSPPPAVDAASPPPPSEPVFVPAPSPPSETVAPSRSSSVFRPNVLPADVEARRAVTALLAAAGPVEQRASIEQLRQLTPDVIALRDIGAVAEVVAGLDRSLGKIQDPEIQEAIGVVAGGVAGEGIVGGMVACVGEVRG